MYEYGPMEGWVVCGGKETERAALLVLEDNFETNLLDGNNSPSDP